MGFIAGEDFLASVYCVSIGCIGWAGTRRSGEFASWRFAMQLGGSQPIKRVALHHDATRSRGACL